MSEDPLTPATRHAVERLAYSPGEAAQALGVTRAHIYELINRGQLRRFKLGRRSCIPAADLRALVGDGPDDGVA